MAKNFPANPTLGDQYEDWVFDGTGWKFAETLPGGLPCGSIIPWAGATAPANWLLCDGSAVSRTTYGSLFAVIGTTYGAGNGSTTFNLPDLRGRVPVGKSGSGTFGALGSSGGAETVTLSVNEMPSHTHVQNAHNHTQDPHSHSGVIITGGLSVPNGSYYGVWGNYGLKNTDNATATNQATTATNQNTGGGGAHNNLQPYQVVNYIIKHTVAITPGESELAPRVTTAEVNINSLTSSKAPISAPAFTGNASISGRLSIAGQPSFHAYHANAGNFGFPMGSDMAFNTTRHNVGNCYNTSNGRFTAPVSGMYLLSTHVFKYTSYDNNINTYWGILVNGNNVFISNHGAEGYDGGDTISGVVFMNAGDYATVRNLNGTLYTYAGEYNSFTGHLLS